jgi:hypothetical protein
MTKQKQISCMGLMLIFPTLPHRLSISRRGSRCVMVEVSQGDCDALVMRGYLGEDERGRSAALKKAIEGVLAWEDLSGPIKP